jgi:hypothetical protein
VFIFAVRCLKLTDFVSFPSLVNRYPTYTVLTSTNFSPLFKGRDTAIFNFSIYHVFIKKRTKYTVRYRTWEIPLLNITIYHIILLTVLVINHTKNVFTHSPPITFVHMVGLGINILILWTHPPHGKTFYPNKNYFWELGVGCIKRIGYHSIEYPDKT